MNGRIHSSENIIKKQMRVLNGLWRGCGVQVAFSKAWIVCSSVTLTGEVWSDATDTCPQRRRSWPCEDGKDSFRYDDRLIILFIWALIYSRKDLTSAKGRALDLSGCRNAERCHQQIGVTSPSWEIIRGDQMAGPKWFGHSAARRQGLDGILLPDRSPIWESDLNSFM